jgi:5-formyltetrahydrofolate cyclo-ligase
VTPPHDDPSLPSSTQDKVDAVVTAKNALREQLRARRRARTDDARATAARGLTHHAHTIPELAALLATPSSRMNVPQDALEAAEAPQLAHSSCIAAYASYGTEPGTAPLRSALAAAGVGVLLPVIRADGELDWAWDRDDLSAGAVSSAIPEPTGDVMGRGAPGLVALGCRVLLAPALGVDLAGHRIGKAGGFYDRLLAELDTVGARPLVVAVVFDDDVVESIPTQAHDRAVDAILTPTRYLDLR